MIFRHLKIQRLLVAGLVLAIVFAAIRFLALQGLMVPIRVTSGSMAPWLRGEAFRVKCQDCEYAFNVGFESQPRDERAVCPNCGFAGNRLREAERVRGQRVLIDRGAFWFDAPQRLQAIAFDDQQNQRFVVKRAIGLPGETIEIRQGEVLVDGRIVRKSFEQFRRSAVVVHDNAYLPKKTAGIPVRWRAERDFSGWQSDVDGVRFEPRTPLPGEEREAANAGSETDWLVYHHWRCYASSFLRMAEAPISDNYGYNQGESRALADVTDLVVRCQVRMASNGWMVLRVHDHFDWLEAEVDYGRRQATILHASNQIASANLPGDAGTSSLNIEFGLLDGQVVFAVNGQELVRQEYDLRVGEAKPLTQPVAIGGRSSMLTVEELVIRRDVYYLGPGNRDEGWKMPEPIPPQHVFFLGDNPSISEDGRVWGSAGIAREALSGEVLPLPW